MRNVVPRWLLVILRVHLGAILLLTVAGKMIRPRPFSAEMVEYINIMVKRPGWSWYQHFLQATVVPHAETFALLVMAGELIAGICLLTGTFTRAGAVIAMFLFLNYMLSKGRWFLSPDSEDAAVFFSAMVVGLGAAGRSLGIDVLLARRWPNSLLW